MKINLIIIFITILLLCFFILNCNQIKLNYNQENYSEDLDKFSFNVITLYTPDRLLNISEQEKILPNIKINKFRAIKGENLEQEKLVKEQILTNNFVEPTLKRLNEIGCYLSHLELLKSLKNSSAEYHIILEDDFKFVLNTNFLSMLNNAINQTKINSFDIIFLGWNLSDDNIEKIYWSDNLVKFKPNNIFNGTYAYMVNSNSIDKIIKLISKVDMPIDTKYNVLYSLNELDLYWLNPVIIEPNYNLKSTILSI